MSTRDRFVSDAGAASSLYPSSEYVNEPRRSPFHPYPSQRTGPETSNSEMLPERPLHDESFYRVDSDFGGYTGRSRHGADSGYRANSGYRADSGYTADSGYRADVGHRADSGKTAPELHELATYPNPFGEHEYRHNPFESGYTAFPKEEVEDLDDPKMVRFRRNERNRRKLEARLPRFHYTKLPWFNIVVTTIQLVMFIVELARMGILTGSPFQTKPYFNPMLGPSTYLLVNMGARYVPCMHPIDTITTDTSIQFPCPNSTSTDTNVCNLSELCGLGGIPVVDGEFRPAQYFRIVLPIFLHAGFLHILFNLLLQLTMGLSVERNIGWLKYGAIYMASGVSGFLLGANFSPDGIASTGASGALFGIIATNLILFIFCGRMNTNIYATKRYKTFILIMVGEIIVSLVLGLLPGLDNFSHIGGFCMGILTSFLLLPDPSFVYIDGIYTYEADTSTWQLFVKNWNPLNNLEDKILWKVLVWAAVRVVSLALAVVYFALLVKNLKSKQSEENTDSCSWCKYINCIPVNGWCEMGVVSVESTPTSSTATPTATSTNSVEITSALPTEILNQRSYESIQRNSHEAFSYADSPKAELPGFELANHYQNISIVVVMGFLCYRMIQRTRPKHKEEHK